MRSERIVFSPHRPQPGLESAVISFQTVVRVPLEDVPRGWDELVDHARVDRRPVGGDFDRRLAAGQRAGKERPSSLLSRG